MKRHLLFAMFCIVCVLGMRAQEVPTDGTSYYLYNVETGKFLTRGSTWGTKAVTNDFGSPWKVTISNGAYTLKMLDIFIQTKDSESSRKGLGDNGYSDNDSPISFTLEGNATDGYTLKSGENYLTSPDNYGDGVLSGTNHNATWQFLNVDQYKAILAAKTTAQEALIAQSADITLNDSKLEDIIGNTDEWRATDVTIDASKPSNNTWTHTGVANRGGNQNDGSYGVECYQGGVTYSHTVTGLEKGIYKVGVKAMYRSTSNGVCYEIGQQGFVNSSAYFSANDYKVQVKDWYSSCTDDSNPNSTGAFVNIANTGGYLSEVYTYVGNDGELELKAVSESFWGYSWFLFNGVTLTYYSNQVSDEDIINLVATIPTDDLPTAVKTNLNNLKNTLETDKTIAAYNALNEAIQSASDIVTAYKGFLDLKEYADALVSVDNNNSTANGTLSTAISDQETAAEAATDATELETATSTLKAAMITYAGAANPVEGAQFDLTFMLTNPNLEGLPTWNPADGWHTDQTDGNSQVMTNNNATSEDGTKTAFYEYWSYTAKKNGEFTLYQEVTLPEGTFKMTCYAFAKQQDDPANTGDVVGIYFYANDTQGSPVSTDRLSYKEVEFVNTTEQNVKVGLKAINPNTYNWMGIGYVQLFKVPAKSFEIDEAVAYDNTQEGAGDVKLTRTIKEGMNAVVLPFQMTAADIEILGGEGAVARTVSEYLPASEDFSFAEVTEVAPNQPFFLYATVASADREDGNVFTFKGKTLVAGEPKAEVGDLFTLVGTYAVTAEVPVSTPEKRNFILNGGKLYNVDSEGVSIHNTRCYIEINIPSIAINEGETFENTQTYKYANVTLTRTIKEGMNTVVVPFELTAEDIAAIGGEGAVAYTVSGYANDNLKFATAETVAANTPFFLNATEATSGAGEFAFEGKKVVAGDPIVKVSADCSLVGTYETTPVPVSGDNGSYYILSGGKFYTVNSEVNIKNTRFYVATSAPAGANTLGFTFDGEANAINGIIANDNAPEGIYNLQGQKVEKATKGIYIINGKKVLVK